MERDRPETLEYRPPDAPASRKMVAGRFAVLVACTLMSPGILLVFTAICVNPVSHHWMTGWEFDQCMGIASFASAGGLLVSILAGILGRPIGWFCMTMHLFLLFFLPAFGYA